MAKPSKIELEVSLKPGNGLRAESGSILGEPHQA
jgi:hypothetical protein